MTHPGPSASFEGSPRVCSGSVAAELARTVPTEARQLAVVVDGYFEHHPAITEAVAGLRSEGRSVHVLIPPAGEPRLATIADLVATVGEIDAIVAVGGGSVIDIAKAVVLAMATGGDLESLEGADQVHLALRPIIAVPTTAGTGSEVTGSCVLTAHDDRRKLSIRSPRLRPKAVVLDSALLVDAPPMVIRAAGVDALGHAIESYTSTRSNPITRTLSLTSVQMLAESLPTFYADPSDQHVAATVGWAACMAGISFNSARVGLGHALASVVAPVAGLTHGTAVGLALPHHLDNVVSLPESSWTPLAQALGGDPAQADPRQHVLRRVVEVLAAVEAPTSLVGLGLDQRFDDSDARNVVSSGRLSSHPETVEWDEAKTMLDRIALGA